VAPGCDTAACQLALRPAWLSMSLRAGVLQGRTLLAGAEGHWRGSPRQSAVAAERRRRLA
jgi:hypothetical protein